MPVFPGPEKTLPPEHGAGLTASEVQRGARPLDLSVSANTRAMYRSVWSAFEDWTSSRAVLGLPASPALLSAYKSPT